MATTVEGAKGIGVAALRKEDRKFITGHGRYVDDIKLPGMLHMAVVRSQYPHADINGIDTSAAAACRASPTSSPATTSGSRRACPAPPTRPATCVHPVRPPLAKGRVRHVGEPIAS